MKTARKAARWVRRRWSLYCLKRHSNEQVLAIEVALKRTLKDDLSAVEGHWIDQIEALRCAVNASKAQVKRIDFGAGDADSTRTAGTMLVGVEVDCTLGELSKKVSKPPFWCKLLFHLVRALRPQRCLELGTAVGISAAYQAAALQLNKQGVLATLEGAPTVAQIARGHLDSLGLSNVEVIVGRFQDTLEDVLERPPAVDFAFIDGHHDERATLEYFNTICRHASQRAVLLFDDIAWSPGMKNAWTTICARDEVSAAIDLGPLGICLLGPSARRQKIYRTPLT